MGGTNIGIARVVKDKISDHFTTDNDAQGTEEQILNTLLDTIDQLYDESIHGIGIGVPSLVDVEKGIVYDVQNIPSWNRIPVKDVVEKRFNVPVYVNNDANCFVVSEKYFGKGKQYQDIVGLTMGTGLGAGIIIQNQLYSGQNCGAGEFGSIPYNGQTYEDYCSGKFFKREYGIKGHQVFEDAISGNQKALDIFHKFGTHLGNAILTILFAVDPQAIFLGGSVTQSYQFFQESMWETINTFPYKRTIEKLVVDTTDNPQWAPILGAAALHYDAQQI